MKAFKKNPCTSCSPYHASPKKGMRMNVNRFAKAGAIAAGFFLLCATPGLTRAQSSPPSPVPSSHKVSPAARPKEDASQTDDFAGLKLTVEQKAKIEEIRQTMRSRMDAVVKDEKLDSYQKDAMLQGYQRLANAQAFELLKPNQQREVREKARARRAVQQEQQALPK
jgi:Spy/CpxP family protein refolding chaperone